MMNHRMSFFGSKEEAVDYGITTLFDGLREKYELMTHDKYERRHYDDSARLAMWLRIKDFRKCELSMRNAVYLHEMHSILRQIEKWQKSKKATLSASQLLTELKPRISRAVRAAQGRNNEKPIGRPSSM